MKSEFAFNDTIIELPAFQWLVRHFKNYRALEPWPFLWRIVLEGFLVVILSGFFLSIFLESEPRADIEDSIKQGIPYAYFMVGIVAPFLETFFLQFIPVGVARLFHAKFVFQLIAAWIPFALLHFFIGTYAGIMAGLITGFYIGFTYTHWRQFSRGRAFWITTSYHMIYNIGLLTMILLLGYLLSIL